MSVKVLSTSNLVLESFGLSSCQVVVNENQLIRFLRNVVVEMVMMVKRITLIFGDYAIISSMHRNNVRNEKKNVIVNCITIYGLIKNNINILYMHKD